MITRNNISGILKNHVNLELRCIDRMYLNVYQPILQTGGGIVYFFKNARNMKFASSALMGKMTENFVQSIQDFISNNEVELVRFKSGERKDDITLDRLSKHNGNEKILYVGVAQEKAKVFRTIGKTNPETGTRYPWLHKSTAICNHYYFYIFDNDFGPLFIKICSYFPYNIRVCLNGHEYLKQQLLKKGIEFEALDNGILKCADVKRMQAIADALDAKKIQKVIDKWLKILPTPFTSSDRKLGFNYETSILQSEFALTQVFEKPIAGRQFFEEVIRENINLGRPENIGLIFGRRVTKKTPGQFRTRIITHNVVPSLSASYKYSKIKQYFKKSKALRTETVVNNTRDFGIGKKLENLDKLKSIAFESNDRLLHVEKISQDCIAGREAFDKLINPVSENNQRASGLKFGDPRAMVLLQALCMLYIFTNGFANKELRIKVASLLSVNSDEYTANKMTYDLRRLMMHKLIKRIPNKNQYIITEDGLKICMYFTKIHSKLFSSGLGELVDLIPDNENTKINRAIKQFDQAINDKIEKLKLAA